VQDLKDYNAFISLEVSVAGESLESYHSIIGIITEKVLSELNRI